jgi:hypothetical protein
MRLDLDIVADDFARLDNAVSLDAIRRNLAIHLDDAIAEYRRRLKFPATQGQYAINLDMFRMHVPVDCHDAVALEPSRPDSAR